MDKSAVEEDDLLAASILSGGVQHANPLVVRRVPANPQVHAAATDLPQQQAASYRYAVNHYTYGSSPTTIADQVQQPHPPVYAALSPVTTSSPLSHQDVGHIAYNANQGTNKRQHVSIRGSENACGNATSSLDAVNEETGKNTVTKEMKRKEMFQHHRMQVLNRGRKRAHSDMPSGYNHDSAAYNDEDFDVEDEDGGPSQKDVAICIMELMKSTREQRVSTTASSSTSTSGSDRTKEEVVDEDRTKLPISPRGTRKRANTINGTPSGLHVAPRNVHNAKEQKRRNDIRVAFEDLRRKLPSTEMNVSKSEILRKACEHIQLLKNREELLRKEARNLSLSTGDVDKRKKVYGGRGDHIVVAVA